MLTTSSNFWMKNLDCPLYFKIQQELAAWLNPQLDFYKKRLYYFEHIDHNELLVANVTLLKWMTSLSVGPVRRAALIINPPNSKGDIHTDTQTNDLALNIGVYTSGSVTLLYNMFEGISNEIAMPTGNTLTVYDKCKLEMHERFYLVDNPVLFNTKKLHQVVNLTENWRVAISLRFDRDPWHLTTQANFD